MSADRDPAAYAAFVARLDRKYEPDLMVGDTVSTAFYSALEAGWTVDDLAADAASALRRSDSNMGLVVSRLRNLSARPPMQRTANVVPIHRSRWSAIAGAWCPCGEPPAHRIPVPLTPQQAVERHDLLKRIEVEHIEGDEAGTQMAELIARERSSW